MLHVTAIDDDLRPDEAFSAQWVATLVHTVVEVVRERCLTLGQAAHWDIFDKRVVRPMLFGDAMISYEVLVTHWSLKDAAQAANMLVTVKRRFADALIEEVRKTVDDPLDVQEELRELMSLMERNR